MPTSGQLRNHCLPNVWQGSDPRLHGCLDIAYMILDAFDFTHSPYLLDTLELAWSWKPLVLAYEMEKAASRIRRLTASKMPMRNAKGNG